MKHTSIKINKKQFLTDVLPKKQIRTNTILKKTLTGLGATYSEIYAKRDSIIIEPNVPVIKGKCIKHKADDIFGVYEGVYADDVVKYLEKKTTKYKKILTTPESFRKIKSACNELGINIYQRFFLLFDECEKIVQDVAYRENIILPMDDFFQFKQKAFVSATPIVPRDPRFKKEKFEIVEIQPSFDYKKEIHLLTTNNVLEVLKRILPHLEEYNKAQGTEKNICIFLNSTDTIEAIIKQLGLASKASVFCSDKSVAKLRERNQVKYTYEDWNIKHLRKYNFFTSRFYSALDIELDDTIDLIMISDIFYAEHSMIDPNTEAIQIIGRFRNGVSSITHISNLNKDLTVRSEDELKLYIKCNKDIYDKIENLYETTPNFTYKQAYREALNVIPYNRFLHKDGEPNYFVIDNFIDEELVKSYYQHEDRLLQAYERSKRFIVKQQNILFPLGDFERLRRVRDTKSLKEKHMETLRQLELLNTHIDYQESELLSRFRDELYNYNPFIVEAYELLGAEIIRELNYSRPKIKEKMILKKWEDGISKLGFQEMIDNSFQAGKVYSKKFIKEELQRIFKMFGIKYHKAVTAETIYEFFHATPTVLRKIACFSLIARK